MKKKLCVTRVHGRDGGPELVRLLRALLRARAEREGSCRG